ncbi:MAG: class I SAM-dependent methyltransferase [Myxococcales bacterium]|nr:class I SAM-dependent methyltransferase [Myxococcales bacterium]MDD9971894.1 class I SAM-dependent methyltransferase [Myxococcales bacterium]
MKTNWDYTNLADAYLNRPDYSEDAIDKMVSLAGLKAGDAVCDVGAGVAHLTLMLLDRRYRVNAVEPNDAMRANGIKRTEGREDIEWFEGTGENTGQADAAFEMVTFGSSFNVTDRQVTLKETKRILKPGGWFACMWNHRDLNDAIQARIEAIIKDRVEGYGYGTRREDQTEEINKSGLFGDVAKIEGTVTHSQSIEDCTDAWRSHATLERQAGGKFGSVVDSIDDYLNSLGTAEIQIPYTTRIWVAQLK